MLFSSAVLIILKSSDSISSRVDKWSNVNISFMDTPKTSAIFDKIITDTFTSPRSTSPKYFPLIPA